VSPVIEEAKLKRRCVVRLRACAIRPTRGYEVSRDDIPDGRGQGTDEFAGDG